MQVSTGDRGAVASGGGWACGRQLSLCFRVIVVKPGGWGGNGESPLPIFLNSSASSTDDTIGDLKKLIAAQTGTRWNKIVLKKW